MTDSIKIGKPVQYALSFRHKPDLEVFFPNTHYDFHPFEIINREFFTTQTDSRGSLDSVIYTLISFDVSPIQKLNLPVYVLHRRDCTAVYGKPDSVFLKTLIRSVPDTLSMQTNTRIIPLTQQTNYPLILLWIVGLLIVSVIIYWFFGQAIELQLKLFQLRRRHADFNRTYQRLGRSISKLSGVANVEKALILWKKYIERLSRKPYSSFTTKEILLSIPDNELAEALREIDMTIYGGGFSPKVLASLATLQNVANKFYRQRRRQIKVESRSPKNTSLTEEPLDNPSNAQL